MNVEEAGCTVNNPNSQSDEMRLNVRIEFPEDGSSTTVAVRPLGEGQYELLEHPFLCRTPQYGDVILAVEKRPLELQFKKVIRRSPLSMATYTLRDVTVESLPLYRILNEILRTGGFWQCDLGGLLWIFFDPRTFDPRSQIEAIEGVHPQDVP